MPVNIGADRKGTRQNARTRQRRGYIRKIRARGSFRACAPFGCFAFPACTGGFETEPLVEYLHRASRRRRPDPQSFSRQLRAGAYLVEIRERDIDLRVGIDAGDQHTELADAYLRHGLHRTVVSLAQPAAVRITLASVDQRNWRGAAAVRILRWPQPAPDAPPDQRLLGLHGARQGQRAAGAKRQRIVARGDRAHAPGGRCISRRRTTCRRWRRAEYQRSAVEFNLLHEFADGRRTAESAQAHFAAAGDATGEARAAVLRALNEFNMASRMGPDVPRAEQRALLDTAVARMQRAQAYFEANELHTRRDRARSMRAASASRCSATYERAAPVYRPIRARARGARRQAVRGAGDPEPRAHRRSPGKRGAVRRDVR